MKASLYQLACVTAMFSFSLYELFHVGMKW